MHIVDFESIQPQRLKKNTSEKPIQPAKETLPSSEAQSSQARVNAITDRIKEIQTSPLWKKVFLRGTLEKELNDLYRKRRELGGQEELDFFQIPDTFLGKAKRYGKLTKKAAHDSFYEAPYTEQNAEEAFLEIFRKEPGKYNRMAAFFTFLRKSAPPELFELITRGKYNYDQAGLPLDPERYQFHGGKLGEGGESTVFRLNALRPEDLSYVIKIDRVTEGETVDRLEKRGSQMKREYEECREWYKDMPGFIPEEYQFIGKSPRGGAPALFTLQEYFGKAAEVQDIFRGIKREELLQELKDNPLLKVDFQKFAHTTLELYGKHGRMVDTLGPNNVSLIMTVEGKRLVLLDSHLTSLPKSPKQREAKIKNLEADLRYLEEILGELDKENREELRLAA